jgi:hypothetical protein
MKLSWWGGIVLGSIVAFSAHAQTSGAPAQATAPPANTTASLSMECHLLYRGTPMAEPTFYRVIGNELYGISGPIKTKLSQAGTPVSLGSSKDADGSVTESFASHTLSGMTLERTVFWKKGDAAMKPAFKETYDFKASTVVSSTDKTDFCHTKGR